MAPATPPHRATAVRAQVISVGATRYANSSRADFSTWNLDVELSAPGNAILSTMAKSDTGRMDTGVQVSTKPAAAAANLTSPAPRPATGAGYGSVTAPLVDCGLGSTTCAGAKGKVCLIQSGTSRFCEKVMSCQRAGGLAVLLYNGDAAGLCEEFEPVLLLGTDETTPCNDRTKYVPTVALTLQQGRAIKALIAATKGAATATVTVPDPVANAKRVRGWAGLAAWPPLPAPKVDGPSPAVFVAKCWRPLISATATATIGQEWASITRSVPLAPVPEGECI